MKSRIKKRLEDKLRASFGPEARLVSLTPLAGDASSRRYHRALLKGHGAPPSMIVMELCGSALPLSSEELAVFDKPPEELPFLNLHRFLRKIGVRIPALYGEWVEDGLLFLEDLGDRSLWDSVQGLPPPEVSAWYEKAIDQLLLLQIRGTGAREESCIAFKQRFDLRLYMWEFEHFIEYGVERGKKGELKKGQRDALTEAFASISQHLDGQPSCLSHRDYHSWNLMVHRGEVAVIDFQDALLAPVQYDLASLLNDRVTDRIIEPELEGRLINYYLERRADLGEGRMGREPFFETYLLASLQRDFKVVGRFEYLALVKGKPGYRRFIPPTLRRIRRNLARIPRLERLIPVLAPHFEEMR